MVDRARRRKKVRIRGLPWALDRQEHADAVYAERLNPVAHELSRWALTATPALPHQIRITLGGAPIATVSAAFGSAVG
jgi:hypothetical protein